MQRRHTFVQSIIIVKTGNTKIVTENDMPQYANTKQKENKDSYV